MRFDNVGVGVNGELKYFLGTGFRIDRVADKRELWEKYLRGIECLFGEGGRFKRAHSVSPKKRREYHETMDTMVKVGHNNEGYVPSSPNSPPPHSPLAMKKSATLM